MSRVRPCTTPRDTTTRPEWAPPTARRSLSGRCSEGADITARGPHWPPGGQVTPHGRNGPGVTLTPGPVPLSCRSQPGAFAARCRVLWDVADRAAEAR